MSIEDNNDKITSIIIIPEVKKKIKLYMEYFREQTDETFGFLENYFREKTILPPIVLNLIVGSETKKRLMDQKMLVLEIASQMSSDRTIDDIMPLIEENLKKYYRLDSFMHNFRKRHKMYPKAQELIKKWFIFRVKADGKNLTGEGNTWFEILRSIHTKKSGSAVINEEISIIQKVIDLIKSNRGLVNVPGIVRVEAINAMLAMGEHLIEKLFKQISLAWAYY